MVSVAAGETNRRHLHISVRVTVVPILPRGIWVFCNKTIEDDTPDSIVSSLGSHLRIVFNVGRRQRRSRATTAIPDVEAAADRRASRQRRGQAAAVGRWKNADIVFLGATVVES